jgi:putative lipoprotein
VVAEETVLPAGQVPVRFAVRYDYRNINPNGTYYLTAQIEQGGRVLFTNDQNYAVLTRNSPKQNVAINLVPTNAAMLVPAPGVVVQQPGVTVIQPVAPSPPTAVVVPPAGTVIVSPR